MFGVKNYVNVYRFWRKYSFFFISTVCFFSVPVSAVSGVEGTKKCNIRHPSERGWGYCTPNVICQSNYLWSLFLYFTMTLLVFLLPSARVFTMMLIPF